MHVQVSLAGALASGCPGSAAFPHILSSVTGILGARCSR